MFIKCEYSENLCMDGFGQKWTLVSDYVYENAGREKRLKVKERKWIENK